jgi:AcrR family transcriptional regulator
MQLVVEKDFQHITITDLAERAFINRSTFYLHFQDKDHLMLAGFEEYWNEVLPSSQPIISLEYTQLFDRLQEVLESDLMHFDQHWDFYRKMLIEQEIPSFRDNLFNHLLKIIRGRFPSLLSRESIPGVPLPLVQTWLTSAYFGVICNWLENNKPESPTALASQLERLFIHHLINSPSPDITSLELWVRQEQMA